MNSLRFFSVLKFLPRLLDPGDVPLELLVLFPCLDTQVLHARALFPPVVVKCRVQLVFFFNECIDLETKGFAQAFLFQVLFFDLFGASFIPFDLTFKLFYLI